MHFENINALWGLLFIPVIILMYILKQNFEQKDISSTFLWDIVIEETKVDTPWQKLKKNILMLLQILVVILIVFALLKPSIIQDKQVDAAKIIVIDNSASMRAKYNGGTRLGQAKKLAINSVLSAKDHTPVTVITVGRSVDVVISNIDDKRKIQQSINNITSSIGSKSIQENYDFIESIANNFDESVIELYTDVLLEDKANETILVNSTGTNVSLDYINTFLIKDNTYEAMAKLTNRYKDDVIVNLELYDEHNQGINSYEVALKGYESKNIILDNITTDSNYVYGEIANDDLIADDNVSYSILDSNPIMKKILLVSEGNTFLEKAILATKRYELYKTNDANNIDEGYDLYIFDGLISKSLPETGAFMFINLPQVKDYYISKETKATSNVIFDKTDTTRYIAGEEFYTSNYFKTDIKLDSIIASSGEDTVIGLGNKDGKSFGVMAFDLYNSDFPTKSTFPILVDRIIGNMLGDVTKLTNRFYGDDNIAFKPLSTTVKACIENQDEGLTEVLMDYPITYYEDTNKLGVYKLIQEDSNSKKTMNYISVEFTKSESNIVDYESDMNKINRTDTIIEVNQNLMPIIIILLLIISMYEWKRYWRG